jgi:hypothetical protein
MSSNNFMDSDYTIHTDDADKIANVKASLATNKHLFIFMYMDGCGWCEKSKESWLEFEKIVNQRSDASAFAISNNVLGKFGSLLGDMPQGFPTFRHIHTNVTEYDGGRSLEEFTNWMNKHVKNTPTTLTGGGRRRTRRKKTRKHRKLRKTQRKIRKTRRSRKIRK